MDGILRYYQEEAGDAVVERFFRTFLEVVEKVLRAPQSFHPIASVLRRADIPGFPYHFLYRETGFGIRVLVLRHDHRHPSYGLGRR